MIDFARFVYEQAPPDATHIYCGRYCKIGRHGFVYRWENEDWIKSEASPEDVREHGLDLDKMRGKE